MKKEKSQLNIWQSLEKPILALAPMAGYTDSAFRVMCLQGGADLVYTEMISAEALARENKKTLKMLEFLPEEKNVIVQLFGKNPEAFAKATKIINEKFCHPLEKGDPRLRGDDNKKICGIDINLGCPAHKVFKTGAGAALMDNKELAREIIIAVLENTQLPVSIKIRSLVKNTTAIDFIKFIKDLPITAVMVHGRTLGQGMTGPIDFAMIKKVKQSLPDKIILANGGISTLTDAEIMLEKTGADGIGIGRGALGNPKMFSSLCHSRASGNLLDQCSVRVCWDPRFRGDDKKRMEEKIILHHAKLFLQQNNNLIPLRKHLIHYFKGQKNASEIRQKIIKIKTMADLEKII